jgi:hypothetical protein
MLILAAAELHGATAGTAFPDPEDAGPLKFFSPHEHRLLRAVAHRMAGTGSEEGTGVIDVAGRADAFLANEDPEVQSQIHLLLAIFGSRLFAFLFDLRFVPFLQMNPADQDGTLSDWMTSSLEFRRTGFAALKRICLSMQYTDSRSFAAIGYEGMFLPGERP